jgi:hypothetical protein
MQSCNGRQAVMSALEALVLAGKGLNAFSVLFLIKNCLFFFQGKGIGTRILNFAESLAQIAQIEVVSCRSDLFPFYEKRGFKEIRRFPCEKYVPATEITRTGLEMVVMQKKLK